MLEMACLLGSGTYLESQVAKNNRPLHPKVAHDLWKLAHSYVPLAFQVCCMRACLHASTTTKTRTHMYVHVYIYIYTYTKKEEHVHIYAHRHKKRYWYTDVQVSQCLCFGRRFNGSIMRYSTSSSAAMQAFSTRASRTSCPTSSDACRTVNRLPRHLQVNLTGAYTGYVSGWQVRNEFGCRLRRIYTGYVENVIMRNNVMNI